ncbi:MAG: MmgE/PrpD family protein [Pseudorhodobacter sp.]
MNGGLTWELCAQLNRGYAALADPPQILTDLFADGICVALAGASEAAPTLLRQRPPDCSGGNTTVFGSDETLPLLTAVRANGAALHVLDYEPMWSPATHCISPVLPALLGLAETRPDLNISGAQLLRALALGIEMQIRLRRASGQLAPRDLTFHPPGIVGPLGAAFASGLVLGLDVSGLTHAVGIAASRAGSVLQNVGSMTKCLHCGAAAADGLEAALLAEAGFRADPDALSGPRGYLAAFFRETTSEDRLLENRPMAITDPGPAFKFYPSQYGTHFVIEAALAARRAIPAGAHIRKGTIRCPQMPYVDRPIPDTGLTGKFSFQYVAAVALLDGRVTIDSFTNQRRQAPDMDALLPRLQVKPEPHRALEFDEMCVDIEIETDHGLATGQCDGPPGFWGRPAPAERLREKAKDCLERAGARIGLLDKLLAVAGLDNPGLLALIRSCASGFQSSSAAPF